MAASAEATDLALALSRCEAALQVEADDHGTLLAHLPSLRSQAASLRAAVDALHGALPPDVQVRVAENSRLLRHMSFIERYLGLSQPGGCSRDPVDIVKLDLPAVLEVFEGWYETHSPTDPVFVDRLGPHVSNGQLNAAVREAWVIFKTRMVSLFNLPTEFAGDRLAGKLFGSEGITTRILEDREREGYLHLFKGLYALSRNPITHNDVPVNPEETEAVLALLNSALVRIEAAHAGAVGESAALPAK